MELARHDRGLLRVYALRAARAARRMEFGSSSREGHDAPQRGVVVATLRERNGFFEFLRGEEEKRSLGTFTGLRYFGIVDWKVPSCAIVNQVRDGSELHRQGWLDTVTRRYVWWTLSTCCSIMVPT